MGNYNNIIAPRNYRTRQILRASHIDDILNVYDTGFSDAYSDMRQIIADLFGPGNTYQLLQRGYATQVNPIIDIETDTSARDWTFTGDITLPSSFTVDQLGGDYTVSFANPASSRTITFPDPGGNDSVVYLNAVQTIANKTFSNFSAGSPFNVDSGAGVDSVTNYRSAGVSQYSTYWDSSSGEFRVERSGGSATLFSISSATNTNPTLIFSENATTKWSIFNNNSNDFLSFGNSSGLDVLQVDGALYDFIINAATNSNPSLLFKENGTLKWNVENNNTNDNLSIINASSATVAQFNQTGELLLPDVDPPTANYINRNSSVKVVARMSTNGALANSYNVSSSSRLADPGQYQIVFDTDFSSTGYSAHISIFDTNTTNVNISNKLNGSLDFDTYVGGVLANEDIYITIHGDQ